ncbi:hypothetical protein THAOC_27828, partial [Thalassiosira oceanica]
TRTSSTWAAPPAAWTTAPSRRTTTRRRASRRVPSPPGRSPGTGTGWGVRTPTRPGGATSGTSSRTSTPVGERHGRARRSAPARPGRELRVRVEPGPIRGAQRRDECQPRKRDARRGTVGGQRLVAPVERRSALDGVRPGGLRHGVRAPPRPVREAAPRRAGGDEGGGGGAVGHDGRVREEGRGRVRAGQGRGRDGGTARAEGGERLADRRREDRAGRGDAGSGGRGARGLEAGAGPPRGGGGEGTGPEVGARWFGFGSCRASVTGEPRGFCWSTALRRGTTSFETPSFSE